MGRCSVKFWRDKDGKRWYTSERVRVTRLFRYHVNTKSNPRGRILRMLCAFCLPNKQITISQFHHVDYKKPFRGVWVCESHHRKIELGTTKITEHKICDYTALVAPLLRPATSVAMRASHVKKIKEPVPF
jgi:hypothetical protein